MGCGCNSLFGGSNSCTWVLVLVIVLLLINGGTFGNNGCCARNNDCSCGCN